MKEVSKYTREKVWSLDTIIKFKDETNSQLALRIHKSVSTVKRYKKELLEGNNHIENIEHKNCGNKHAQIYSDELIRKYGEQYDKEKLLAGGLNANSSCNSYLSLYLFHSKIETNISYSQLVKRLKQNGYCSAYAYKTGRKEARDARKEKKKQGIRYSYNSIEIKIPKKKAPPRLFTRLKYSFGDCIEIDGARHFYVNDQLWTAISSIDVASGLLVSMHLEERTESLNGHQFNIEKMINRVGLPKQIITDKRKNFFNDEDSKALTYNAINKLGIELITTSNPNGKPHIERVQGFIEQRLAEYLKRNNINTLEEANAIEEEILKYLNSTRKSVIYPKVNHFRTPNKEVFEHYFDLEIKRKINNGVVLYKGKYYAPYENGQRIRIETKFNISFVIGTDKKFYFRTHNKRYEAKELKRDDMETFEYLAYIKKLPLSIPEVKTLMKTYASGYTFNLMLETKLKKLFDSNKSLSNEEKDLLESIHKELVSIRKSVGEIIEI